MAVDRGLVLDRDVTDIGAQIKKYMDREQGVEKVQNIRRCTDIRYGILPPQQQNLRVQNDGQTGFAFCPRVAHTRPQHALVTLLFSVLAVLTLDY